MNAEQLLAHYDRIADAPDAIVRLRRFVLDLAVRGKLVQQSSGDEPAGDLLKRMLAEKSQLKNAGKLPSGKVPAIVATNLSPYEIPTGWKWVAVGAVVNAHIGGGTPSKNNPRYWNGDIFWASVKDIGKSKFVDSTIDTITDDGLSNSSSNLIEPGHLIVVTRMGLGKISVNRVPLAINQDLRALAVSSLINIDYCYLFFRTHEFNGAGLTVKGIKVDELLAAPFPLPPIQEQNLIVAKVDELMALCDELEVARTEREATRDLFAAASLARLNEPDPESFVTDARIALDALPSLTARADQIRQVRQTILSVAVRGMLVSQNSAAEAAHKLLEKLSDTRSRLMRDNVIKKAKALPGVAPSEVVFDIPVGWAVSRLGEVYDVRDGTHDTPKYVEKGVPLVTSKNISSGFLSFDDVKFISEDDHDRISTRSRVDRNDILFAMIGSIGNPVIVDSDTPFSIKNVALFKYYDRSLSCAPFLRLFLEDASNRMKLLAAGGLQPFVSLGFLRNYPIVLPPLEEQHRIVAKVDELMAICDQLEASLTSADDTRRRLLDALLAEALQPALQAAA